MAEYKVSKTTDKSKIFIVNRSELLERIDPDMVFYNMKTKSYKFDTFPLKSLLKRAPQYGANESGIERVSFKEPRYIRITDIDEFGLLKDNIGATAEKIEDRFILNNGDILFARSGNTVGKTYLHKKENVNYDCFFAGYMIRFIVDEEKILPDYLFTYTQLNIYKKWVNSIQRSAGQPNINAEEYKSLLIPLPPKVIQQQIVEKINYAYQQKKHKETQAKELLTSIEKYLLNELRITLPERENSLQSRIFTTNFSEVSGGRFDAVSNKSKDLEEALLNAKYSTIKLSKLIKGIKTGTTPHNSLNPYVELGIPFLRNSNLQKGEIDLSDIKYIKEELAKQLAYSKKNEIIVCIAGTVGESAINTSNVPLAINQNITALDIDNIQINTKYLNYFLNTELNIELTKRLCSVATILYLNNSNLLSLNIPLPPQGKQTEIANHIEGIHSYAKQLQEEAKEVLYAAKKEVEEMILG